MVPGIHQTTIARIESGQRSLRVAEALALARILEQHVENLAESSATSRLRETYRHLQGKVQAFDDAAKELIYTRQSVAMSLDQQFPGYGDDSTYESQVLSNVNPGAYTMLDELLYTNSSPEMRLYGVYSWARRSGKFPFEPWVMSRQLEVYEDIMLNGWGALKVVERADPDEVFELEVLTHFRVRDDPAWYRENGFDPNHSVSEGPSDGPEGFRLHDLRHYYASLLIASGLDVKTVSTLVRHANAAITLNVYGHLWPDRDETGRTAVAAVFSERLADSSRTGTATSQ